MKTKTEIKKKESMLKGFINKSSSNSKQGRYGVGHSRDVC